MKKIAVLIMMLSASMLYAGNHHFHPVKSGDNFKQATAKSFNMTGSCVIKVINPSSFPVHVEGQYLDGDLLQPFNIYPVQDAQVIELLYYQCMPGMDLTITGFDGYVYLDGYVAVNSTIIIPERLMGRAVKAMIQHN